MSLVPGMRLGPYEIVAPLGAGGMGEVYRGRDTRLGREVAVKVLPAGAHTDSERLQRFATEARATGALNHPNILALYDVGQEDGAPYVVSELLEGETLAERLKQGALPVRKALDVARQIAQGLAAAHDRGVVHRDLKPENVFLTRDGHVKLLDFGLARLREEPLPATESEGATLGRVLGTAGYMSPEQVRGEPADERSDIFSFGTLLYEMLAGRRAFKGGSAVETLNSILKDDPPQFEATRPGLPPGIERILWHCLEKLPGERFQSARDLAFDLESLATGSFNLPPLRVLGGRAQRRVFAMGLGAFLAGALCTAAALALWPRPQPSVPGFQRLTFRRGTIEEARFAPDGQAVVYGAAWAGAPLEVFSGRVDSPESRPLGLVQAELLALSSKGEMALSLKRRRIGTFVGAGTLARAPLAGGAPREVLEDVQAAAFTPDGAELAVVRSVAGRNRLEYPVGQVLFESAGWIGQPRFAPDGRSLAFVEHPVWGDDGGHVTVVDLGGRARRLSRNWGSLQGLAWHPGGAEVWFTGTREGAARALQAVALDGRERSLLRVAGVLTLHDLLPDGRALISHHEVRREMAVRAPGAAQERDLSWLDYCFPSDFSDDGQSVFFAENGEGGGAGYSVWLRRADGSAAVRLGQGAAMALSPDGRWALASERYTTDTPQLKLIPTGAGQPREVPRGGINTQAATFLPDGRHLLLTASAANQPTRVYVQDVEGGAPRAVAPEGTRFTLSSKPLTPDGRAALLRDKDGQPLLYDLQDGTAQPVAGLEAGDEFIRWSADGQFLYAYRPGEVPARVVRVDTKTARREPWFELQPADRAGVLAVNPVQLTPDGRAYVYGYRRVLSDLYVVTGVR